MTACSIFSVSIFYRSSGYLCTMMPKYLKPVVHQTIGNKALQGGLEARLISAKLVATIRQNQKTDKNDALAIVQAAQLPEIRDLLNEVKFIRKLILIIICDWEMI